MKLTAHIPPSTPLTEVCSWLRGIGLEVRYTSDGLVAAPPECQEHHTNATIYKFPSRKRQFFACDLPGPEVA